MRIDEMTFDEYERLFSAGACYVDNPFLMPGAFRIWRRHYGESSLKLQIFALRNADESRGKAVFLSSSPLLTFGKHTLLRAMGTITGTELARASAYHRGYSPEELSRILALARTKRTGPVFKCNYLPRSSLAAFAADRSCGNPLLIWMGSKHTRVIEKLGSYDDYLSTCPRTDLREVQRVIRRLSSRGEIQFREFGGRSGEDIDRGLSYAFEVSGRSWKADSHTNLTDDGRYGKFYREILAHFAQENMLRVQILFVDDQPIASLIDILYDGVCYCYKTEYDRDFRKYYAGSIIFYYAIGRFYEDPEIKKIDFLSDYAYLRSWAPECDEYSSMLVFSDNWLGKSAYRSLRLGLALKGAYMKLRHRSR